MKNRTISALASDLVMAGLGKSGSLLGLQPGGAQTAEVGNLIEGARPADGEKAVGARHTPTELPVRREVARPVKLKLVADTGRRAEPAANRFPHLSARRPVLATVDGERIHAAARS